MTTESLATVRVSRPFSAPPERVFDAWLDPSKIRDWMKAPARKFGLDDEVTHVAVDARVGGAFSFIVRRQGQDIEHKGEYLEIVRPRRLVFTWRFAQAPSAVSRVTVELTGVTLALTHESIPNDYADRMNVGWRAIVDSLAGASG
jgi:uncharacterized protein YndB with AHSA1/START domain